MYATFHLYRKLHARGATASLVHQGAREGECERGRLPIIEDLLCISCTSYMGHINHLDSQCAFMPHTYIQLALYVFALHVST